MANLEGMKMKFTVIKNEDLDLLTFKMNAKSELNAITKRIEEKRRELGKKTINSYLVINTDEPYVEEIIEILKRNGHWN